MGPIDYTQQVQAPFQAAAQGYQLGAAIRNDQQQQAVLAQQQAAAAQQQKLLSSLANNPNANGSDYARVMTAIPGLAEPLTKAWAARNADQQQAALSDLGQWGSAIKNGEPQIAVQMMNARADAMEKTAGGPTPESQAMRTNAKAVEMNPQLGLGMMMAKLAAHPDASKVAATLAALGQEQRAAEKAPADLRTANADAAIKEAAAAVAPQTETQKLQTGIWNNANTKSQIEERSQRLGLDRDKLTTETQIKLEELRAKTGELPEDVRKDLNGAATDAIASEQSSAKMTRLADQIDQAASRFGTTWNGSLDEWWKRNVPFINGGGPNDLTRMRAEYNRIVTPAAMAAYKKVASGSTSDRDIETAMIGVPKDTDSPMQMASFLRGAAKLQEYDAIISNAKSEWLAAVKHLGKAARDIEVDGVKVPAGTTFKNFTDLYVDRKMADRTAEATIAASPYAVFAKPAMPAAAPTADPVRSVLPVTGGM